MTIRLLSHGFVLALLFHNSPSGAAEIDFKEVLSRRVINADLPLKEVREFCEARLTPVPEFKSAADWQKYADALRNDVLDKVVFRGEAAKWRQQKTKAEWLDTIGSRVLTRWPIAGCQEPSAAHSKQPGSP